MTALRNWRTLVPAAVVLGALLLLQRTSAHRFDDAWLRENASRHDLSLYAALVLGALLLATPAAERWAAARRPTDADPPTGAAVDAARTGLIWAARGTGAALGGFLLSLPVVALVVGERATIPILVAGALAVAAGAVRWAAWPFALASLAVSASAVWAALAFDTVDQTPGPLVVQPVEPGELYFEPGEYDAVSSSFQPDGQGSTRLFRRGPAPVLIDLRHLRLRDGATVNLVAQSDLDRVVVALPERRCMAVRVHERVLDRRPPEAYVRAAGVAGVELAHDAPSPVGGADEGLGGSAAFGATPRPFHFAQRDEDQLRLVGFGEAITPKDGEWRRDVADPRRAATLDLDVWTGTQVVIRDYPSDLSLAAIARADTQGALRDDEASLLRWPMRNETMEDQSVLSQFPFSPNLEHQAQAQANRIAGPCATDAARARVWIPVNAQVNEPTETTWVNGLGSVRRTPVQQP
ncbi:MAG: hypothetical protein PGN13_07015 [Patulibacter minatonensis]